MAELFQLCGLRNEIDALVEKKQDLEAIFESLDKRYKLMILAENINWRDDNRVNGTQSKMLHFQIEDGKRQLGQLKI